jgi:hypothetical protein
MALIRKNLPQFHENLTKGLYSANGPLVSPNCHWNYDGVLVLGSDGFVEALTAFVDNSLRGLDIRDIYRVVDGRYGATLYRLQGFQSGDFSGVPFKEGTRYNAHGTEMWEFGEEGLLKNLVTVDQIGVIRAQFNGSVEVPPFTPHDPPVENPQTSEGYREMLRRNINMLQENISEGHPERNAALAVEDVEVDENGVVSRGRDAFAKLISMENAGFGKFPKKRHFYDRVLAEGHVGVVDYVWQEVKTNGSGIPVRQRGMMYFECDDEGLVKKAIGVYDDFSVKMQMSGEGQYGYP